MSCNTQSRNNTFLQGNYPGSNYPPPGGYGAPGPYAQNAYAAQGGWAPSSGPPPPPGAGYGGFSAYHNPYGGGYGK